MRASDIVSILQERLRAFPSAVLVFESDFDRTSSKCPRNWRRLTREPIRIMSLNESFFEDDALEWFRLRKATARHVGELSHPKGDCPSGL